MLRDGALRAYNERFGKYLDPGQEYEMSWPPEGSLSSPGAWDVESPSCSTHGEDLEEDCRECQAADAEPAVVIDRPASWVPDQPSVLVLLVLLDRATRCAVTVTAIEALAGGTRSATQEGRPGAAAEALRVEARQSRVLRDPSVLPDLDGDDLEFEWDFEHVSDEATTIIRHGGRELWREPAVWEGDARFRVVFDLMRHRYGDQLASLTPTDASELWLDGDQLRSRRARAEQLESYRRGREARNAHSERVGGSTANVKEGGGRFYVIQDPGDVEPYALVMVRSSLYWWWTREGWVDTPMFAAYFSGGEIGARPVDPADLAHWKATIPKPSPSQGAQLRGRP